MKKVPCWILESEKQEIIENYKKEIDNLIREKNYLITIEYKIKKFISYLPNTVKIEMINSRNYKIYLDG